SGTETTASNGAALSSRPGLQVWQRALATPCNFCLSGRKTQGWEPQRNWDYFGCHRRCERKLNVGEVPSMPARQLTIPELALVVLIGPSGAGKSTFARRHFRATEILSSDVCRGLVCDDENDQTATRDAFEVLRFIAAKRLAT